VNGDSKPSKKQQQQKTKDAPAAENTENLSPAELKKRAKAEKAARRAKVKETREQPAGGEQQGGQATPSAKKGQAGGGKDAAGTAQKGPRQAGLARRGSAQGGLAAAAAESKKREDKSVAVFGHLYGNPRRSTIAGAAKEVHPAVLALGLQMRDYVICGSSARCVATLLAFKRVSWNVSLLLLWLSC
jgi:translation initiation factor eIF-2B subunit delta